MKRADIELLNLSELYQYRFYVRQFIQTQTTYAIVASRIGFKDQKIIAGKISSLKKIDFGTKKFIS